jgi:hypothetical protein
VKRESDRGLGGRKLTGHTSHMGGGLLFIITCKVKGPFGHGEQSAKTQGKRPQGTELRFLRM